MTNQLRRIAWMMSRLIRNKLQGYTPTRRLLHVRLNLREVSQDQLCGLIRGCLGLVYLSITCRAVKSQEILTRNVNNALGQKQNLGFLNFKIVQTSRIFKSYEFSIRKRRAQIPLCRLNLLDVLNAGNLYSTLTTVYLIVPSKSMLFYIGYNFISPDMWQQKITKETK